MAQFLKNESFGNGIDGAYAPSTGTDTVIDSACTGTINTNSLSATNVLFAAGQLILIHQTQGTGAGQWELNRIAGYTAGTITTKYSLTYGYATGTQVLVIPQYSSGNIAGGVTITTKAWNGTVGGIYAKFCNGTFTIAGNIVATGCGFRGGTAITQYGTQGEGTGGTGSANVTTANGNGGGAGNNFQNGSGSGGGNGTSGGSGTFSTGGNIVGSNDLTTMSLGGGGGGSGWGGGHGGSGIVGSNGGGIIYITGVIHSFTGSILSNGLAGTSGYETASGAGAGGSILIKAQVATLGTNLIQANGGASASGAVLSGGAGGAGRVALSYLTSYTGTSTPTINITQDSSLANSFLGGML